MKQAPLLDRLEMLMGECEKFLDDRAKRVGKECPGVPVASIRESMVGRFGSSVFSQALGLLKEEEVENV